MQGFTFGEIDEEFIRAEGSLLKKQKAALEAQLGLPTTPDDPQRLDAASLSAACMAVSEWPSRATDDDRRTVLEALQISIVASRESASLTGVRETH